ncbi:uncharacterized protein BT62DRAFT_944940 [Guyanagaster necrorhizus]|uniref:Diphthine--ammonia ligase n=1 Tax=Guyanagaster necrorhizus TaxID=856835 RepID=A0A9P7VYR8_9AGAR|nr:uncharacterized protein BT62DRAFT_944940 [Guyanagaster necrorhizus MCA 3950]KAG7449048.1 hypothetical protein BT62DRAFT_944940 [Guyanagaster necrorhizus MCA 3950]
MKYVALLSGGKDSCFNLLHCAKNGHELVAAASLGPEPGKEELDSYLYQTVGQDAIEIVARALDVPLYRRVIRGSAVEQGAEYGGRNSKGGVDGDETEDLYELLTSVKSHHPDITGVSVGAILSNYQRVRVEHVCRRLSLSALCYLWQRPQDELLSEMIDAKINAVLIKVAGIGLSREHLGKSLGDMKPLLFKLNEKYGSHICGEGGEYESLTLDCPLFKSRISLLETEVVIHSDNDFATVAYLRVKNAVLLPKDSTTMNVLVPPLLISPIYTNILHTITSKESSSLSRSISLDTPVDSKTQCEFGILSARVGPWITVSNVQSQNPDNVIIEEEVTECFNLLQDQLTRHAVQLYQCTNINIFVSSMDLFARINAVYATFFGTSPPARACVAVDLPRPRRLKIDCIAFADKSPADRQALHVQSLSYWAPANIGPYSQAIISDERAFISGQIGLIPPSLSMPSPSSLAVETVLSIQHADRIVAALKENSNWMGHCQATIFWLSNTSYLDLVAVAHELHEKYIGSGCPAIYAVIKSIPKDALVEKQVLFHTGRCLVRDEYDDEMVYENQTPVLIIGGVDFTADDSVYWEISRFQDSLSSCVVVSVRGRANEAVAKTLKNNSSLTFCWPRILSIRLFYIHSRDTYADSLLQSLFGSTRLPPITSIPCRFLSSRRRDNCDFVLCLITA